SAQEWTDHMVESAWRPMLAKIGVANDDFIRTTEARHTQRVQEFWARLHAAGEVYSGTYTGPYCVSCEEFKLAAELIDGDRCPVHGAPVSQVSEENYFFRLSGYADRLLAHYREHPEFIRPASARNEVLRFVEAGLADLSITRSTFDWGVPVPWDTEHVLYVWIDALLNYVTAVGFGVDEERFQATWPADVHLVGKDILRFHAVIWPAMLMAAGLALPRTVFAHGWLLVGGEKMSKTKLTGIVPGEIVDTFGADALRYYLLREIAFGSDGSFSWEGLAAIYKAELADDFGNLASRVTAMVDRYRGGVVPAVCEETSLAAALERAARTADERMGALDFQGGIVAILEFVKRVNGFVTEREPWQLARDPERAAELDRVLYAAGESLRAVAVLLAPVIPGACESLWAALGAADAGLGPLADQRLGEVARWGQLPAGARVTKLAPLFPRLAEVPAGDPGE
ncbi:MAG: methionine--tRNA ligase, partial [Mycobacteriales bacterium]